MMSVKKMGVTDICGHATLCHIFQEIFSVSEVVRVYRKGPDRRLQFRNANSIHTIAILTNRNESKGLLCALLSNVCCYRLLA